MDTESICEAVRILSVSAKDIYIPKAIAKWFDDTSIELDTENHLVKLNGREARIQLDTGLNNEIGYSAGKLVWALREVLTGIKQPKMVTYYPSSMYYGIEVMKHTDEAILDILDFLK